jgi:glutathione peroxidase
MKKRALQYFLGMSLLGAFVLIFPVLPLFADHHPGKGKSLHDFTVEDIFGDPLDLSTLKGKKVMVVNTASRCGLTPQYEQLESLYQQYNQHGFVVIGFPANNFRDQEPGTNEEILEFCQVNYGVTFPMMSKVSVMGDDIAPVYQWLTSKEQNGLMDVEITWNFQKFLIDEDGQLVDYLPPRESPMSPKVIAWIEGE